MTDSKDRKTTITLEPGQVAVVLGMDDGQISRQLFASPEVDAMLDDEHSDIPSSTSWPRPSLCAWIRMRISPPTWPSDTMRDYRERQAGTKVDHETVVQILRADPGSRGTSQGPSN
jgi:hypothetical protein